MSEWRTVTLGDACSIEKGTTGLAKATPGKYPLVATGAERRTCSEYQFDTEAVCIPLVSSTGHGEKTLNYVHFEPGKFALGTILAAVAQRRPPGAGPHIATLATPSTTSPLRISNSAIDATTLV
jgi:type I restriction enzyme, S subunit